MKQPYSAHPDAVVPKGLRVGHVVNILRVLGTVGRDRHGDLPGGDAATFHSVVYHLAGGAEAALRLPPMKGDGLEIKNITTHLHSSAKTAYGTKSKWANEMKELRRSGNEAEITSRLSTIFDLSKLAAVKSMAIIADAWLWPMLRAIEPGDDVHILDVCPVLWPRTLAWLEEAAANPQSAIDGSLSLRASFEGAGLCTTPRREPSATGRKRSERAAADLARIRAAIDADAELKAEVHAMLSDAFTAMAGGVRNHAAEFMPTGAFCTAKITPEMRKRLDGMPLTSVAAETMFARVKRRADRGGRARHDTRMGAVLCERDGTVGWARGKADPEALKAQARKR